MLSLAAQKGFTHYHLTEHIPRATVKELYPEEIEANIEPNDLRNTFNSYILEARAQQKLHSDDDRLSVLVGAELENVDGRTQECLDFVTECLFDDGGRDICKVDFLVGSVHHVYGIPIDFDAQTFEKALQAVRTVHDDEDVLLHDDMAVHLRLMIAYLDAQYDLLQRFRPEVIGHFDLCRLYRPQVPMTYRSSSKIAPPLQPLLQRLDETVRRNISFAVQYGALFEVNSASMRKGWQTPYPGQDILDVILQCKGRLCLSDDAHSHEQVALNYHRTYEYLNRNHVEQVYVLVKPNDGDLTEQGRGTQTKAVPMDSLLAFVKRNR